MNKGVPREEFINDSDIENCDRIFLEKARAAVKDFKDLGISFRESKNDFVSSVVRILQNVDEITI